MLSLDAGVRGLFLPQLSVPNFVDFPWEPLFTGRSRWGWVGGRRQRNAGWRQGNAGVGVGGRTLFGMQNDIKNYKKKNIFI